MASPDLCMGRGKSAGTSCVRRPGCPDGRPVPSQCSSWILLPEWARTFLMQVGELPTCQKLEVEIETATRFIFCRSMLHIPDSKVFMKLLCPSIFQRLAIEPKDSPFLAVQVYGPQKPTVAESFRAWAGLRSAAFRRRGDASFIQEHQMICYADEEIGVLEISKTGNVIIQDRDVSLGPPCTMIEGGYALATSLQEAWTSWGRSLFPHSVDIQWSKCSRPFSTARTASADFFNTYPIWLVNVANLCLQHLGLEQIRIF